MERLTRRILDLEQTWRPIGCDVCRTWSPMLIRIQEVDGSFTARGSDSPDWPHDNPCCPACGRVPENDIVIGVDPRGPA